MEKLVVSVDPLFYPCVNSYLQVIIFLVMIFDEILSS